MVVVVLDEEREALELRQQAPQQPRLVHRAQGRADPPLVLQEAHEGPPRLAGVPEGAVDRAQPLAGLQLQLLAQLGALVLGDRKRLQQAAGTRRALLRAGVELPVPDLEAAAGPAAQQAQAEAPARRRGRVPDQEAVGEAVQVGGVLVVVPHERLGGQRPAPFPIAEAGRHRRLEVQREQIGLPAGREVRLVADAVEVVVGAQGRLPLAIRDAASLVERAARAEPRVGDPQPWSPQAARSLLDLRLEVSDGAAVAGVASASNRSDSRNVRWRARSRTRRCPSGDEAREERALPGSKCASQTAVRVEVVGPWTRTAHGVEAGR